MPGRVFNQVTFHNNIRGTRHQNETIYKTKRITNSSSNTTGRSQSPYLVPHSNNPEKVFPSGKIRKLIGLLPMKYHPNGCQNPPNLCKSSCVSEQKHKPG